MREGIAAAGVLLQPVATSAAAVDVLLVQAQTLVVISVQQHRSKF
jgi:hypothetical protein